MNQNDFLAALQLVMHNQAVQQEQLLTRIVEQLAETRVSPRGGDDRAVPRMNIPNFHGGVHEDVSSWLYMVNQNMCASKVSDERKALVASGYLRDAALQWYRRLDPNAAGMTWENFKSSILSMFQPPNLQEHL